MSLCTITFSVEFPTITICLDDFGSLQKFNGSLKGVCSDKGYSSEVTGLRFIDALDKCLDYGDEESATENDGLFGNLFDGEMVKGQTFKTLDGLMKAIQFIKLEDMITGFKFGNQITMENGLFAKAEDRAYLLKDHWTPFLHYWYGFCYSFESIKLVPIYFTNHLPGRIKTEMKIDFEVRCFQIYI